MPAVASHSKDPTMIAMRTANFPYLCIVPLNFQYSAGDFRYTRRTIGPKWPRGRGRQPHIIMKESMKRALAVLLCLGYSCAAWAPAPPPAKPKLILAVVVDQFRYEY